MDKDRIYKMCELALAKDFNITAFIRCKKGYNIRLKEIHDVEAFDYDNYINIRLENGSNITLNCDDIHEFYVVK